MISYYIILSNLNKILAESHSFFTEKKKTSIGITFFSPRKTRLVYHGGFTMMHGGIKNGITMGICQQYDTVIGSENRGLPPMIVM
jgi:hypothetical protein